MDFSFIYYTFKFQIRSCYLISAVSFKLTINLLNYFLYISWLLLFKCLINLKTIYTNNHNYFLLYHNMTIIFYSTFRNSINYVIVCALTLTHGYSVICIACIKVQERSLLLYYFYYFLLNTLIFFYYNSRNNHYLSLKYLQL